MRAIQNTKQSSQAHHLGYRTYYAHSAISLLLLTVVTSAIYLSSSSASATGTASDTKTSTATVTVSASCSMTANVTSEHTATLPNGVWSGDYSSQGAKPYENGIGSTTIQTFCNDPSGYAIYAVGFSGDQEGNTYLRSSTLGSSYDINTGTAKSGDTSSWSMKLASVSGTYAPSILSDTSGSFADYHAVPSNYTKVASFGSATDATVGSSITTTYGTYVSGTQPAGTYTGKVKYTLVHPASEERPDADTLQNVKYWGGSLVVGEEKTVTDNRDGKSYTVARICTQYDGNDCTSSQIWMTQNLDLDIGVTGTAGLTSVNTDLNTMYDANGNVMPDYNISGSIISWTPTTANTTVPGQTTNTTLTGTPAVIADNITTGNNADKVTGWYNTQVKPYMADGKTFYMYTSGSTGTDELYATKALCETAHGEGNCNHYAAGNYYNFTAATAMSDSSSYTKDMLVMENSICPRGWRLPNGITSSTGGSTGDTMSDFNKIFLANGITNSETHDNTQNWVNVGYATGGFTNIRSTSTNAAGDKVPLYFVRSGDVDGSVLNDVATYGLAWSSTVKSSDYGYFLSFYSGGLYPARQTNRLLGFPVRCLAR